MKFRKLILASAISSALLLAGCGGGSDSESDSGTGSNPGSTTGATFSLTGVVVKGVVKNGVVTAYELVGSSWVARGSATTNDKGEYMLAIPAALYKGGIVKIALTSNATTQMKCELSACGSVSFGEFYSAPSTTLETLVSSTNIAASGISNIPITPYTNLVAGRINALVKEDGIATQADVAGIAAAVRSVVGFEPLTTKAVDITNSAAFNAASTLEQTAAIMSAAVAELAKTSSQDVSTVVSNMASAYADGVFNESDTFQLSTLVQQWNDVQHDSSVKTVISSASAAVAAVDAQVEVVTTELADGTYTPTPSADLASFLNGLSEFYIVGGDHHLWLDDLVTSGTNQYSFQSKKQLTSTSLYTPESDDERYVLTTSGWSLLGDPDSVTLTPNTATGQINGVDNMGSFTMSGSCADIANTTFSSQLSALNNTSLSSYVDVNTRFPSGSYACAVTNNSNEPEISIQIWDNGTNSVSMSGVGQVTTLAELFTTTVPVDGASSISNGIYVSHGYQLMLVGDSSASQGQALLMNNTGGSYSIVANVASNGWVKETTNGVTIIRIADAIRSYITDDIHDGFYGFTEYDGRVQQVSYYMAANEPFIFMNKTAYDAIMAGHVLDTDDDGVADTVDPNPTDPNIH